MVKAIDVADYILTQKGTMSAMKLQKLIYYAQAWHLVWEDKELFSEEIQAWANGPVVPSLYSLHQGIFSLEPGFFKGDISSIPDESKDVIDRVLEFYGDKDAQWLSDLTHMEEPWKKARIGLVDGERGNRIISNESMSEYYSSI
ncbi:Panacea domain-containing protein [Legionella dresdenensis]|uniref:Panacea domain-containing protein n=1 Tax=Legionella dresdenensis TaxID=450200 RepID=A0ABV8CGI8_9GAMM